MAAMKETRSIPIAYAGVYDPNGIGLSGKNITGISSKVPMASLLKYLLKLTTFTKLAIVYNESEPDTVRQAEELAQLESQYGFQLVRMPIRKTEDTRKLIFAGKADAVFISLSATANEGIDAIVSTAHAAKITTVSQTGGTGEKGVILSIAPSASEQGEAAGRIVVRLLKGDSPASIPAEFPKLVELVLNLREANALGLKVPMDLITEATKVIK
jgi:putative ABC transport system substrate-binding protein